jgi:hypothetical protein
MTRIGKQYSAWNAAIDAELLGESENAIRLSRYTWMTPETASTAIFPPYMVLPIIPIAKGIDGSWVAWVSSNQDPDGPFILSSRDDEYATVIGNEFGDALFFLLVEELQNCWLDENDEGETVWQLGAWIWRVRPFLNSEQVKELATISSVAPTRTKDGGAAFITQAELRALEEKFPFLSHPLPRIRQYAPLGA